MSTTTDEPTEYVTSDLSVAGFLTAHGRILTRVDGERGGRRLFVFPASERDLADSYYTGASVPARQFSNALRDLKSIIYNR
jgi:hypothetical protein